MSPPKPNFRWPRFLIAFIGAPLLVTLLTFWAFVPLYALVFGGPLYLIAGLPLTAWYLRNRHPSWIELILLSQACQLLQVPIFLSIVLYVGDWDMLEVLPTLLFFGAIFALIWISTFLLLYLLLARVERPLPEKEQGDVHS